MTLQTSPFRDFCPFVTLPPDPQIFSPTTLKGLLPTDINLWLDTGTRPPQGLTYLPETTPNILVVLKDSILHVPFSFDRRGMFGHLNLNDKKENGDLPSYTFLLIVQKQERINRDILKIHNFLFFRTRTIVYIDRFDKGPNVYKLPRDFKGLISDSTTLTVCSRRV